MADYHAILKRAIGALPEPTGEARRAVYEKARAALVNQLKSFDPPLSASEITQQRLQLEDAIRKVEGEAAKGYVSQSLSRAAGTPTAPTGRAPAPSVRPGGEERPAARPPSPRPVTPAPTAPTRGPVPPPGAARAAPTGMPPAGAGPTRAPRPEAPRPEAARPEASRPEPVRAEPTRPTQAPRPAEAPRAQPSAAERRPSRLADEPRDAGPPEQAAARGAASYEPAFEEPAPEPAAERTVVVERATGPAAERRRLGLKDTTRAPAAPVRPSPLPPIEEPEPEMTEADMVGAAVVETQHVARPSASAAVEEPSEPEPSVAAAVAERPEPKAARKGKERRGQAAASAEASAEPQPKPNRLPLAIGLSVAGLVVAVGVTALWTKRDEVASYFGTEKPIAGLPRVGNEKALAPKVTDRLVPDDGQASKTAATTPGAGVKVVTTQPITATPQVQPAPSSSAAPAPGAAVAAAPPAKGTGDPSPLPPTQAVPPVAQKAMLLEEAPGGTGQNVINTGKVVWRTVRESPGAGKPPVTMIKAQIDVPDRGLVLNLSIQPNSDNSFPASHLIELKFEVPPDFDNKGVSNVPGLILKQTEQARGDPLVGAAARISAGFFWIALAAPEADKVRNLGLLKERGWIDIPILFDNGRRGILTLEKGGAGDRVVADAFAAWSQGG